jgi:hypothetical protein
MKAKFKLRLLLLVPVFTAIISTPLAVNAQEKKVDGKVTDENGNPLNGASILVKGTKIGTNTDEAGSFSITFPIKFYFGDFFFRLYLKGNQSTNLAAGVKLVPDEKKQAMNEVVVTGYGTQRKSDLTGAIGSIARKDFANKPFTSPDQMLTGRLAA